MIMIIIYVDQTINDTTYDCNECLNKYQGETGFTVSNQISGAGNLVLAFALSIYILVAIYSFVFAYRRLERPGVSKEARTMFLKKHLYYVVVFTTIWTIQLSSNYFTLFNPATTPQAQHYLD
jgi:hypothetical protein